jgi:dihydrolipoamide dehydrogenase
MSTQHDYDLAVIGSGPGGYVCAIRAAQRGAKVVVIERDRVGGVCLNVGCIPTKTLIRSAEVYSLARQAGDFGVTVGEVGFDYAKVAARKEKVLETLRGGVRSLFKANGIEYVAGTARLAGQHRVSVAGGEGEAELSAAKIVLATGTRPAELPVAPFDGERIVSSSEVVGWTALPESIVVVGGGYIGCELALLLAQFDVKVTVVELMDRLLPVGDADCSKEVLKSLKRRKVGVHLGVKLEEVKAGKSGVKARLSGGKTLEADVCLVSVGRRANTEDLGLEAAGLQADERGIVAVDECLRTRSAHIYAIGDITGKIQLAHVASAQGMVAAEHLTGRATARMDYRVVPSVVFTSPEVASVGMTEAEAKEACGGKLKVGRFAFRGLGKGLASGETEGWVKVIADGATNELLGLHIVGAHASEMLAEGAMALELEATLEELAETIHAHPTLPEALMEAAEAALGRAIHMPPAPKKGVS